MSPDFSGIYSAMSAATVISSFLAAAALFAFVGFVVWSSRMIGQFYDHNKENDRGTSWVRCDGCNTRVPTEDVHYTDTGDFFCDECHESWEDYMESRG